VGCCLGQIGVEVFVSRGLGLSAVKKLRHKCCNFFNGQDLILFSLFFIKHLKLDLDH
jgi:hypothetical protein